jgi:hypothetical protein
MKIKYFISLVIITTTALYIYQDKSLQTKLLGKIHQVAPELNNSTLYKWQNSRDEWQITDKPPQKGIPFSTISSQDQINVMPSPSVNKKK